VRNLPDGRVEAVFEGEAAAVDSLVHWCREGPRLARVSDVQLFDEDPQGETGFVIR
jgi:acylphosphatase